MHAALGQKLARELLARARNRLEGLCHEALEVQHLDALATQELGKAVVLGLRHLEEGDVVEQQAAEVGRHEVQKLRARPVQAHTTQPSYLVGNVKREGPGVCLNRMYQRTRRRETIYGRFLFACHPAYRQVPLWDDRDLTYHVEGGDVLVLGERAVAVGLSQRTEAAAIDTLAARLIWDEACPVEEVWAFRIPESRAFMHLDTVLTQIDVDKFTVHPGVLGTLQVFRISRGAHEGELAVEEVDVSLARVLARILGLDGVRLIRCGGGDPIAAAREQWNDGSSILLTEDVDEGLAGANVVYTDIWVSMGESADLWAERIKLLSPYQVNAAAMAKAADNAVFMHCLPSFHDLNTTTAQAVHEKFGLAEMEVTDEVFESERSVVFDEAENRMHSIKAVMYATLKDE